MKLIWHLIKNDVRRDRAALLLWALLFVVQAGLGVLARHPGEFDFNRTIQIQIGNTVVVVLQMAVGYILVGRLVQADTLIGTTVFWRTRPISPRRLLGAKVLGVLLLFGLLPVLLLVPWWLYCGFGWREVSWTGVETLGWQLVMIAPAFLVASLTDDIGRLLLWSLMLVLGLASWAVLLGVSFSAGEWRHRVTAGGIMYTRFWLAALLVVLGAGAIAAHHFLTRNFIRSVVLVVCWLGLIAGVGRAWSRDWSGGIATLADRQAERVINPGESVTLKLEAASGRMRVSQRKGAVSSENAELHVLWRANGVPDGLLLGVQSVQQRWTWPEGVTFDRGGGNFVIHNEWNARAEIVRHRYSLPTPVPDEETEQAKSAARRKGSERAQARGVTMRQMTPLIRPADQRGLLSDRVSVPNSLFAKILAEPPAYEADLRGTLYRPEITVEVSVAHESADASGQGESMHFRRVGKDDEALVVTMPSLNVWGPWYSASVSNRTRIARLNRRSLIQVNRVTGDVILGNVFSRAAGQMLIGGVAVYWSVFDLESPKVSRNGQMVAKYPEWQKDTFLAMVVDREVGQFERTIMAEKFEARDESDPQ